MKVKWPNHIISIYNSYFFTLKKKNNNNNKIKLKKKTCWGVRLPSLITFQHGSTIDKNYLDSNYNKLRKNLNNSVCTFTLSS